MSDDLEHSEEQDNSEELAKLQKKLLKRCSNADIEAEVREYSYGDSESFIVVSMPNGREKRLTSFSSIENINRILSFEFEKYTFLGEFVALANYSEKSIEAVIRPINGMPRSNLHRKIFGTSSGKDDITPIVLEENYHGRVVRVELGETTNAMQSLSRAPYSRSGTLSIKISGINISQHDNSLELLRKISDSLFFQLDLQDGFALSLVRDRRFTGRPPGHRPRQNSDEHAELEFPKIEFDEGPISLYWYGRSALGMPLLQYLAFYQVIEYYYPTYSQEEAKRKIRTILKDPTFRTDRDGDIGKVLTAVSGHGRGFGDERSQLRATIMHVLIQMTLGSIFKRRTSGLNFFPLS